MKCKNCNAENNEDASLCSVCGTVLKKAVPNSITVNVPPKLKIDDDAYNQRREIPKPLLAVLIAMGALMVVGIVVVGVLLLTQPNATAAVGPVSTESEIAVPSETPSLTATPVPTTAPTTVPTTAPEATDDFSVILQSPANEILEESLGQ